MWKRGLTRILVASDEPSPALAAALDKALALADPDACATVDLMVSVYERLAEEPDEVFSADQRRALQDAARHAAADALAALAEPRARAGVTLAPRVEWSKDAASAISDAARRSHAQLVVKPLQAPTRSDRLLHTPLDRALTRQSPCPVLLSSVPWDRPAGCILAAVDAGDRTHRALSREIIRQAWRLGAMLEVDVHIATAYPDLGQITGQLQVASDYAGIKADMRAARQREIDGLLAELQLEAAQLHLLEGRTTSVITNLAQRLRPAVTVVGSAARRGVARLVLGSTAETLMARLDGDLLAVREPWR